MIVLLVAPFCTDVAVGGILHDWGGFGHWGFGHSHFGWAGHHGHLGGFHHGGWSGEWRQTRYEDRFDDLVGDYNDLVVGEPDYLETDEYVDLVDSFETLVDRYDMFVDHYEYSADRIADLVEFANEDSLRLDELLQEYLDRDDLSEERLERIENRLERAQDHVAMRLDQLTTRQETLQGNLDDYLLFQDEITTYLDDILAAEGGEEELLQAEAFALVSPALVSEPLVAVDAGAIGEVALSAPAAVPVPEPSTWMTLTVFLLTLAGFRAVRRRLS